MRKRGIIGLGSNLQEPLQQLQKAIDELANLPGTRLLQSSSFYRSPPMGPTDQPDYINAVVELETGLDAHSLLDGLQKIENGHGRVREERWGPRTLDLDILLYGDDIINDDRLQVPHPGIAARNFVLYPMAEITPDAVIPGLGKVSELLLTCPNRGLERLEAGR